MLKKNINDEGKKGECYDNTYFLFNKEFQFHPTLFRTTELRLKIIINKKITRSKQDRKKKETLEDYSTWLNGTHRALTEVGFPTSSTDGFLE